MLGIQSQVCTAVCGAVHLLAYTSSGWRVLSDLKPAPRTVLHTCNGHSQSGVNIVQLLNRDIIATRPFCYFFNGKQGGFKANQVVISIGDVNDHSAVGAAVILVVQTGEAISQMRVRSCSDLALRLGIACLKRHIIQTSKQSQTNKQANKQTNTQAYRTLIICFIKDSQCECPALHILKVHAN